MLLVQSLRGAEPLFCALRSRAQVALRRIDFINAVMTRVANATHLAQHAFRTTVGAAFGARSATAARRRTDGRDPASAGLGQALAVRAGDRSTTSRTTAAVSRPAARARRRGSRSGRRWPRRRRAISRPCAADPASGRRRPGGRTAAAPAASSISSRASVDLPAAGGAADQDAASRR